MRGTRAAWTTRIGLAGVAAAMLAAVAAAAASAQAGSGPVAAITVSGAPGGDDTIDLGAMSYAEAASAFDALLAGADPSATLAVAPDGFAGVTLPEATVHRRDGASLAVTGATDLLGHAFDVVVTAVWDAADDPAPDTAVFFHAGELDLAALTGPLDFPVELGSTWLGVSRSSHTVDPAGLPETLTPRFGDPIALDAGALSARTVLAADDPVLRDAANQIGLAGDVRLDGRISASLGVLGGSGAPGVDGLSLTATLPTAPSPSLPAWFAPTGAWTLSFSADADGAVHAGLGGEATLTVGTTTADVTVAVGLAWNGSAATISLDAAATGLHDLLGATWLDVDELRASATFTTGRGSFAAELAATLDLADLTGTDSTATAVFDLDAGSDGTAGSLTVTTDAVVPLDTLAGALLAEPPESGGLEVAIDGFGLYLAFDASKLSVAVTAGATATINDAVIDADLLVRVDTEPARFLVAVRPAAGAPDVTVGQLVGVDLGVADITLPSLSLTAADAAWEIAAADLDAPTAAFVGEGNDLAVDQGVAFEAGVFLPQELQDALSQIGVVAGDPLTLAGRLPVLGATGLELELALPKADAPPFKEASLALYFEERAGKVEFGISGEAVVAVPRALAECAPDCTDDLAFTFDAGLKIEPAKVSFTLAADLSGNWQDPFGVRGLTIAHARVEVGVTSTPPALTLGLRGDLAINGADYTLAFLLGVTPSPPFIEPKGFTFAASSFTLLDLVALHDLVSDEDVTDAPLPGALRAENVFVSFGLVADADLCIRQGFFLTAELHLGGEPATPPAGPCTAPPEDTPNPSERCLDRQTCLASILVDVDTGAGSGTPSFRAAGLLAAADLGPLHFDPTRIELELSKERQRLFISGGASLDDPLDTTEPIASLARGSFVLDFTSERLSLSAHADLIGGDALRVTVTGSGNLDLTNPEFVLDVQFGSELLDTIAEELAATFDELADAVERFGDLLASTSSGTGIFTNLETLLEEEGASVPQWLKDLVAQIADVESVVRTINNTFKDAGLPPPSILSDVVDLVFHGATIGFEGLESAVVAGICLGIPLDSGCWIIPPIVWEINGLCDVPGFPGEARMRTILCGQNPEDVVGELFEDALDRMGLEPPANVSGEDVLRELGPKFTDPGVRGNCGFTTFNYGTHTLTPTEMTVDVHGQTVVFEAPLSLGGSRLDPDERAVQAGFDALLGDGLAQPRKCRLDSKPVSIPAVPITLALSATNVPEGTTVSAGGEVNVPDVDEVTIAWGDGASETVAVGSGGGFEANHHYADDVGPGPATTFTVVASVPGQAAKANLVVRNVAPSVSASITPDAINEGGEVSLTVGVDDPGPDSQRVRVAWQDGSFDEVSLSPDEPSYTFTRTVPDDDPSGTAADDLVAHVVAIDKDTGRGTSSATVRVANLDPTGLQLSPTGVLGAEPEFDPAGRLIVKEAEHIRFDGSFSDAGLDDFASVVIDWGDGVTETVAAPANESADPRRTFAAAHRYADDDPTGTPADAYTITATVTDDDTGSMTTTLDVVVHDQAPALTSVVTSATAPREAEEVQLTIAFDDPSVVDTHVVEVDWKDGTVDVHNVAPAADPAVTRTLVATHVYADDDPTGTPQDLHAVAVKVTDDDTLSDSGVIDLDVTNVAPVVESLVVSSASHAENETDVTLELAFTDVSLLDSHTVVIDWGPGWSPGESSGPDARAEDAQATTIAVAAPGPAAPPDEVAALRSVTASNRFGDDGEYVISVTVTDDDTGAVADAWALTVASVDPVHGLNDSVADGATATAGGQTFIAGAGDAVVLTDSATDPGSDDLGFAWDFGDGAGVTNLNRVDVPEVGQPDPHPSPQVAPRDVTDRVSHAYGQACLYGVSVYVTDDDDGDGGVDHVAVVIQRVRAAGDDGQRNFGQWRAAITGGTVSAGELACYLDVAGHLSSVLVGASELAGRPWAPLVGAVDVTVLDEDGVPAVLTRAPGSAADKLEEERIKLDRDLLSAWLNFADGAWAWDTPIEDSDGDKVPDVTFSTVMAEVEAVRNASTDPKAVQDARQRLWQLGQGE